MRHRSLVAELGVTTLQVAVTVVVAWSLLFLAVTVLPGDPIRALFGFRPPPPEIFDEIVRTYRLDQPLLQQWLHFLGRMVTGDLGMSYEFRVGAGGALEIGRPVGPMIARAIPTSAVLVGIGLAAQATIGTALGVLLGRRPPRPDQGVRTRLVSLLASAPILLLAIGLLITPLGALRHDAPLLLPAIALSIAASTQAALLLRPHVAEQLRAVHVSAARSRGVSDRRIVWLHALRPALPTAVAFGAANVALLAQNLILVEVVYELDGIGGLMADAISRRDRGLIIGIVAALVAVTVVANRGADLLQRLLDPRTART